MQIAAIAYDKLAPEAKNRVDALIKLNPDDTLGSAASRLTR
jgi:hypothetical protein